MKRYMSLILIVFLLLTSCAGPNEPELTTTAPEVQTTAAVTATTVPATEPATEPATTEPELPKILRITLAGVGDNLIHNTLNKWAKTADGYDYTPMYAPVAEIISEADVAFINQETVMGGEGYEPSGYPLFNSPQEVGIALAETGFDVICHANNHALDKGMAAVINTADFWSGIEGVSLIGINRSQEERDDVTIVEISGYKFAFLAYSYGTNGMPMKEPYLMNLIDTELITSDVVKAKSMADAVIVSMHWGEEYSFTPSKGQKQFAQLLADLGVALVIGHHPHVLQPAEWVYGADGGQTFVAYSLGNFISSQDKTDRMLGGLLSVVFECGPDGVTVAEAGVLPLVTHYDRSYGNFAVYPLYDYTDELGAKHFTGSADKKVSVDYLSSLARRVLGDFVLERPLSR